MNKTTNLNIQFKEWRTLIFQTFQIYTTLLNNNSIDLSEQQG